MGWVQQVVPILDRLLHPHAATLGKDFHPYRNHVCRVACFHCLLEPEGDRDLTKVAVAAVYHDLGIWAAGTFDYLQPSVEIAARCLREQSRPELIDEVTAMILNHHKLRPCCGEQPAAAECFRRADWMDISAGTLKFGVSGDATAAVMRQFPNLGFHRLLLRLSLKRAASHPWNPLPMVRW